MQAWVILARIKAMNSAVPPSHPDMPTYSTELNNAVPALNPNNPINSTVLRPHRSLRRPQIGLNKNTIKPDAAMIVVICTSDSPISRPNGASIGNNTVNPIPTLTREASSVRLAWLGLKLSDVSCKGISLSKLFSILGRS